MKQTILSQLGILTILLFRTTNGENIVFLSLPMYSHLNPMVKTANELADLGHTSYILIPGTYRNKFHPIKDGVKFIIVEQFQEWLLFKDILIKFWRQKSKISTKELEQASNKFSDYYLFNDRLFQTVKSLNISLAVIDGNPTSIFFSIFAYKLNIPFLLLGLHIQPYWHRTPWAPSVFPHRLFTFSEKMTFLQKLRNLYSTTYDYVYPIGSPSRSVKEYVPERLGIDFNYLMKNCELFIIDTDIYLDFALSALPNVKYIGGLATSPARPLKGDILEFMNSSKYGVIIVSSGSFVSWTEDHENKMAEAFRQIKYDVIWKQSNLSYSHQNILLTKWLPQNDLLAHPQTKLFITHCGNSGQYESLYHAIPMIGFPIFGDQPYNCNRMKVKGYGISMDMYNYNVEELVKNIEKVIENSKYKKNIARMSQIFHSQKERPTERAARHIDEIIKYGGSHLRSACQDMSLYEFLMLDIWIPILFVFFFVLYLTVFILRKCYGFVARIKKPKTE